MKFTYVKIITTAPHKDADKIRQVFGKAGAGSIGNYRFCSFSITGKGRFMPTEQADPHIGKANRLEVVEEEQIEVICERDKARQVIEAIRKVHPYEEPIIDIAPLLSEDDL